MTNSADPDQLASEEANWSGSTLFAKTGHVVLSKRRVKAVADDILKYILYKKIGLITFCESPIDDSHVMSGLIFFIIINLYQNVICSFEWPLRVHT